MIYASPYQMKAELEKDAELLYKKLKKYLSVQQPVTVGMLSVIPYTKNVEFEIRRTLGKLQFMAWKRNPKVYVKSGGKQPLLVTADSIILLGESVPKWKLLLTKFEPYIKNAKLNFKSNPLGDLDYKSIDKGFDKEFGFDKSGYSKKYGLTKNYGSIYQLDTNDLLKAEKIKPSDVKEQGFKTELKEDPEIKKQADKFGISEELAYRLNSLTEQSSPLVLVRALKSLWTELNKSKFGGKLKMPDIKLMRNQGASMKSRGYYRWAGRPGSLSVREIKITPRLFNGTLFKKLEVFLHEMCHEATIEISQDFDRSEKGHGPTWKSWMVKVGLDPNRYDHTPNSEYGTKTEKAIAEYRKTHKVKNVQPGNLVGLVFNNKIVEGVVTNIHGRSSSKPIQVLGADNALYNCIIESLVWLPKYKFSSKNIPKYAKSLDYLRGILTPVEKA